MKRQFKIVERYAVRTTSIDKYYNEINSLDMITPDQEHELAMLAHQGDEKAREKLILANLRFVISVAKAYAGPHAKLEDLINEGNLGLIEASHKFDPTTGFKFISFAVWYIRKEIFSYLSNKSRLVRLPQNRVKDLGIINRAMDSVRNREQLEPTIEMVIDELDKMDVKMTEKTIDKLIKTNRPAVSLEGSGRDDDERDFIPINVISDGSFDPTLDVNASDFNEIKGAMFKKLSVSEQLIITKRLGLDGDDPMTFDRIGERLGISGQSAINRYQKIIRKLRRRAIELGYTPEKQL